MQERQAKGEERHKEWRASLTVTVKANAARARATEVSVATAVADVKRERAYGAYKRWERSIIATREAAKDVEWEGETLKPRPCEWKMSSLNDGFNPRSPGECHDGSLHYGIDDFVRDEHGRWDLPDHHPAHFVPAPSPTPVVRW